MSLVWALSLIQGLVTSISFNVSFLETRLNLIRVTPYINDSLTRDFAKADYCNGRRLTNYNKP